MTDSIRRRLVSRLWLPALVVVVAVLAGIVIDSAHGIFGSQDRTRSPGGKFSIAQFNPKRIEYDLFGDLAGWGRVSYWDVNSRAIAVDLAVLPWTHTEITVLTTATADITAQVAGGNIGCRITVDGQVRSEHTATGEHAGVWCQVLSA
ncbi:MmpS family transport accessory protein [Mycobacterium montefiorense]|uniref:Membrane protein, MmpS family n=1 Tax=Mycobacterium montefiorense TaxID=154654 RepID=A0AA37URX6_9MYCO|nr:MmpS family transport accessory protein [Mycobacterium montefiorense]GBG36499.1 putative membrane protein, MmpS family [Mycobacterium montefiorense]GKU37237.1 putative membrane protein, MmpS family [Mycobacterium montefiorense]GKU43246.1 putative membrane protein, MmpS family [Mycobacterium montefiorense]GKU44019.1 putative membrane protein, MmpS family [Mycobacterium montefiorense]GKU53779.1 putative membrane protein, MmpS family [Mycobacterium montefiorense]